MALKQKNRGDGVGIITFYNKIFVPSVKSLLEEIRSAEPPKQAPQVKNNGALAIYFSLFLFLLLDCLIFGHLNKTYLEMDSFILLLR